MPGTMSRSGCIAIFLAMADNMGRTMVAVATFEVNSVVIVINIETQKTAITKGSSSKK